MKNERQNLLDILYTKKYINDQTLELLKQESLHKKSIPSYIQAKVAIGGLWIATVTLSFLEFTGIIDFSDKVDLFVCGCVFIIAAFVLQFLNIKNENESIQKQFLKQYALGSMMLGKVLVLLSSAFYFDSTWGVTFSLGLLLLMTYFTFNNTIDRLFTAACFLLSIYFNIIFTDTFKDTKEYISNGVFFLELVIVCFLWLQGNITQRYMPIANACMGALEVHVIGATLFITFKMQPLFNHYNYTMVINSLLACTLVYLISHLCMRSKTMDIRDYIASLVGIISLSVFTAPGILFCIFLLILSYAKHEHKFTINGITLLPIFLAFYYYNLETTLFHKSGILIGSGVILLFGWYYLKLRKLVD